MKQRSYHWVLSEYHPLPEEEKQAAMDFWEQTTEVDVALCTRRLLYLPMVCALWVRPFGWSTPYEKFGFVG